MSTRSMYPIKQVPSIEKGGHRGLAMEFLTRYACSSYFFAGVVAWPFQRSVGKGHRVL